ncbi:MAG: DUF3987 domain-containing protein [Bacteroidetes bacterium]|nr:DUF3987 domain-containing protein [Bacteroidota bacterium]
MEKRVIIFQGATRGMIEVAKKKQKLIQISLPALVAGISTGVFLGFNFMEIIERIRKEAYKSDLVKEWKSKLPFVLGSVYVEDQDLAKPPVNHIGVVTLDGDFPELFNRDDRMNNARIWKQKLENDPYILLMFYSPQFGLKLFCKTPPDLRNHDRWLQALANYFKAKYGFVHDKSCNGSKRLVFLSYDPSPYVNPSCLVFDRMKEFAPEEPESKLQNKPVAAPTKSETTEFINPNDLVEEVNNQEKSEPAPVTEIPEELKLDIEFCLADINARKIDITVVEKDWHAIGLAFASLGEQGRNYFHAVSEHFPKYNFTEADREFDHCLKYANGSVGIKTFFYHCKQHGIAFRKKTRQEVVQPNAASVEESVILSETPTFDQSIYESLPQPLRSLCLMFDHVRSRDMVLASSLALTGAVLYKVYGKYAGKIIHPPIFVFIVAPPASNKSVVSWSKKLGSLIEGYLAGLWKTQLDEHAASEGNNKDKPTPLMFFVPANSSSAGLIQLLSGLETGIVWESEADTLSAIMTADFGGWLHTLRDIFDHAPVKQYRKTDKEFASIDRPILGLMITGTPGQVTRLVKDGNAGIHSRFVFYGFEDLPQYISPFSQVSEMLEDSFNEGAREIFALYNFLRNKEEGIKFSLTEQQKMIFDQTIEKWMVLSHKSHGNIGKSVATRLGEILFRVAMTLTALRTKCQTELICSDVDFDTAVKIADTFRIHSLMVLATFPEAPAQVTSEKKNIERFFQALPIAISSKDAVAMHKDFGVSDRTIQRYLKKFREAGRLVLGADGVYTKRG